MGDIDQLMVDLSEGNMPESASEGAPKGAETSTENQTIVPAKRTKALGFVIIALVLLLSWLPWWFPVFISWLL